MKKAIFALAMTAAFVSCGAGATGQHGGSNNQNVTVINNVISINNNQHQVDQNTTGLKQEVKDRAAGDANLQNQLNGAVAAGAAAYGQVQGQIGAVNGKVDNVNNDLQASKNYQQQVNAGQSQVNAAQSGVNNQVQGQISQTNSNLNSAVAYQSGVNQAQAGTNQHVQQLVATINDVNASQQTQINTSTATNNRQDVTIGQHTDQIAQLQDYSRDMDSRLGGRLDSLQSETRHALKVGQQAQEMAVGAAAIAMQQFCTGLECGFQSAVSVANSRGINAMAIGFGGAVSENWFINGAVSKSGSTTTAGMSVTTRW